MVTAKPRMDQLLAAWRWAQTHSEFAAMIAARFPDPEAVEEATGPQLISWGDGLSLLAIWLEIDPAEGQGPVLYVRADFTAESAMQQALPIPAEALRPAPEPSTTEGIAQ